MIRSNDEDGILKLWVLLKLLQELANRPIGVVVKEGALINIFSPLGFLQHSLGRIVHYQPGESQPSEHDRQHLEEQVLAFDHLTYLLLTSNRWQRCLLYTSDAADE